MPDAPIEASGLVRRFGATVAVAGVDLRVGPGRVHGMAGPNGAGKTTLLAMILGLVRPDAGEVRLFGRTHAADGARALDGVGGFVEAPAFYPYLTGRANLALLADLDGGGARDRIGAVLELAGLGAAAGARVGGYSVGMRQRLGLAAALLRDPRLLILDEPTSGLDPSGRRDVRALVARLAGEGVAVLLSSHDMDEVEDLCDDVTIVAGGRAVFDGTLAELRGRAPAPAFRLATGDDPAALALAADVPGVTAEARDDGLLVRAPRERLDAYVIALGRAGVAVRALALESSALRGAFFALTEGADA
ncbi:putative ABC transporter ATP-binding protein YxlF [Actinomadura rubteroloni]|uniref:Putative ABC transporter ATP-binding protein YxlF n=1 Tax=Actinomadura rubteroloni TaxID=1926885 RepID=A0A2P4UF29_9ACTN|nr:ABC transporter ATP-binding protein [Actinomadura rubteroloni]POM23667.1 putative ABC transporter ATP-binding protein YxlF [Actinomadura rubteroloni]